MKGLRHNDDAMKSKCWYQKNRYLPIVLLRFPSPPGKDRMGLLQLRQLSISLWPSVPEKLPHISYFFNHIQVKFTNQ